MMVLVAHAVRSAGLDDQTFPWLLMDRLGILAITAFFMLSGFFLYRPVAAAHLAGRREPSTGSFFRRRAVRVLPAYWAALTVALWVFGSNRPNDAGTTLLYYSLTQSYRQGYDLRGLFVAWTLVVEVGFYVTLPLLALALCRLTPARWSREQRAHLQMAVLGLVAVTCMAFRWWVLDTASWKINWPPCFGDWFVLGMLMGLGHAWVASGGTLPSLVRRLAEARWLAWSAMAVVVLGMTAMDVEFLPSRVTVMVAFSLFAVAGSLMILPFALAPTRESVVMRTLGSYLGEWLGLLAYGVYLWHGVLLPQIDESVLGGDMAPGFWPRFLLLTGASFLLGAVSWYGIEQPSMRALDRWEQRRRNYAAGR